MKVGASELRSRQGKPETQRATRTENHHKPCPGRHHGLHPHYARYRAPTTFKAPCQVLRKNIPANKSILVAVPPELIFS